MGRWSRARPGPSLGDAGASGHPGERVARIERARPSTASRRVHVDGSLGVADEDERRLDLLQLRDTRLDAARIIVGQRVRVGEQRRRSRPRRTKPKSSISSNAPARPSAGPSSRIAMRISWISRMLLVLVRSRPGSQAAEQRDRRGELAVRRRVAGDDRQQLRGRVAAARPDCANCRAGSAPSRAPGACGRSPRERAPACVSHVGERVSHSLGPRLPNSNTNSSKRRGELRGVPDRAATAPTSRGSAPPSRHRRCPTRIGMIRSGRPTAVATPLITPTGTVAMYVVKMCWANSLRWIGSMLADSAPTVARSVSDDEVGTRRARSALVSARSVGQLGEVVERLLAEHPRERAADLLRQVGTHVAGHLLVRRNARLGAEELLVHHLPRQTRGPLAERAGSTRRSGSSTRRAHRAGSTRRAGTRRDRTRPSAPRRRASRARPATAQCRSCSGVTGSGNTSPTLARV